MRVTAGFFRTLGAAPVLGRDFNDADMRGDPRVVILSHRIWQNLFQSDPRIVGQSIRLDRQPWTVIGVLPAGFQHVGGVYRSPLQGDTVDAWWPLRLDVPASHLRYWHYTNALVRLKPGISIGRAQQDFTRMARELRAQTRAARAALRAPAFVNLVYLPMIYLPGFLIPLPASV